MTTKAALLKSIRAKCLDCSCYQPSEVQKCTVQTCALWPFRFGKDPAPSRSFQNQKPAPGCEFLHEIAQSMVEGGREVA